MKSEKMSLAALSFVGALGLCGCDNINNTVDDDERPNNSSANHARPGVVHDVIDIDNPHGQEVMTSGITLIRI